MARGSSGETLYPLGTYTFTIDQDLNSIRETYSSGGIVNLSGITRNSASVTFIKDLSPALSPQNTPPVGTTVSLPTPYPSPTTSQSGATSHPTSSPLSVKTTYTPLPEWVGLVSIFIAGLIVLRKNR
jgi:hypothetical protein